VTERWRKKLRDLDKVGPTEDVFERAQIGPQRPEDPIERPSTGTRIVTAIAAFTVFALAIAVFAIPALRLKDENTAASFGFGSMLPVWPVQTLEQVQATQAEADGGSTRWTNPDTVARRFAADVLGWDGPDVLAQDITEHCFECPIPGSGPSSYPTSVVAYATFGEIEPSSGPSGYPGPFSSAPSRIRTYAMGWCPGDVCIPNAASITIFQPVQEGDGGVWMVLDATSHQGGLSVDTGEEVGFGSRVSASVAIRSGEEAIVGIRVGVTGSDCTALVTASTVPFGLQNWGGLTNEGTQIRVPQPMGPDGQPCRSAQPAYAFVATLDRPPSDISSFDPIADGAGTFLNGLTAVPFVALDMGEEQPSTTMTPPVAPHTSQAVPTATPDAPFGTPTSGATPLGDWTGYQTQGLGGYGFDVPTGWTSFDFSFFDTRVTQTGTIVSNWLFPSPGPDDPRSVQLGDSEVRLTLEHRDGGPAPDITSDDHDYPLVANAYGSFGGPWERSFRVNGTDWVARLEVGPGVPQADADAMDRVIGSLAFPSIAPGKKQDGWTAIAPTSSKPVSWANADGNVYVVFQVPQGHVVIDPVDTCGEGQNMTTDPQGAAVIECPDGSTIGYTSDGQPLKTNPQAYQDPLDTHPAIVSWDGMVLSELEATISFG